MVFTKDKGFYRELATLALPIALASLVSYSITLFDNMMIAPLGNTQTSAVYLSNQVALLLTMLSAAIEGTVLVLSSQLIGASLMDKARRVASLGILLALGLALVFFVLSSIFPKLVLSILTDKAQLIEAGNGFLRLLGISFLFFAPSQAIAAALRCIKKAKIALFSSLFALVLNVSLNFVLIYGKFGFSAMGIIGAGVATLSARIVEFSFLFIYAFFIDKELKLRLFSIFKIDKSDIRQFFKIGAPIIATQIVWSINSFFSSSLMGHQSEEGVVTGLSVAIALYNLTYVVTNGTSGAVGVITGRIVGKGDQAEIEKMRGYSNSVQLIFVALGLSTALLMQATKLPFISLWGVSGAARGFALAFINLLSVFVVGTAYQSASLGGIIKSAGDVGFVFKTESFFVFCVIIPFALLATSFGASPIAVFAILKCDQLLKCPVAFFKLKKFKFKKLKILKDKAYLRAGR